MSFHRLDRSMIGILVLLATLLAFAWMAWGAEVKPDIVPLCKKAWEVGWSQRGMCEHKLRFEHNDTVREGKLETCKDREWATVEEMLRRVEKEAR